MIQYFHARVAEIPTVWIDTETTGLDPTLDRAVQVGFARFEGQKLVGSYESLVYPDRAISTEASAIHGITDARVATAPSIAHVFAHPEVVALLKDAQPGAYNAPFDRFFVPPFGDWSWPWLDALTLVRVVDKYVPGKGRHRLSVTAERHGLVFAGKAHTALADACVAGALFYKLLAHDKAPQPKTVGGYLKWQREREAAQWHNFTEWRFKQPAVTETGPKP